MSRTTLCVLTAAGLAALSVGLMVARCWALGDAVRLPVGAGAWKVTMVVQGKSVGDAHLTTSAPLDLERQHVVKDDYRSEQLLNKPPDARRPERRQVLWSKRGGAADGPFRARCEFHVVLEPQANAATAHNAAGAYAAPEPGKYLDAEAKADDHQRIAARARALTADREGGTDLDRAEALYHFVDRTVHNEPTVDGPAMSAAECLASESGDCAAKSRLLAALLRSRNVPARLATGVALTTGPEQRAHYWVEAWLHGRWFPMCPFYHHFGHVPHTYLIFGFGDQPLAKGRRVHDLDYGFLVERVPGEEADGDSSVWKRAFVAVSLYRLPSAERRLVEILLLLPVAALIICIFRNVIGLDSYGAFAPALIGLAFHGGLNNLPGILVFVTILLIGWLMRRVLDRYHLLQVPRVAVMLTLIMCVLIAAVVGANWCGASTTAYISLFPLVILTGMVERFWTREVEDGTASSFKTLLATMVIATAVALVLSIHALSVQLLRFPETLGLVMAGQLLIGRYTGYRLTELVRFRDFLVRGAVSAPPGGINP
jgi:hypothetical protein